MILYRKIFVNLLLGFVLFPSLLQGKYWVDFGINPFEKYGSLYAVIVSGIIQDQFYLLNSIVFTLLILLPFQVIKDSCRIKKGNLSYISKILIFAGLIAVLIVLFGTFSNIWWDPWYYNFMYLVYALGFGILFTTLLYFAVDRYTEKQVVEMEGQ